MSLGQKIKQARIEAGLTQRELCGDEITRNMLSQIENNTALPSLQTLKFLAGRLEKNVAYFLEEEEPSPEDTRSLEEVWNAFEAGEYRLAFERLEKYGAPDSAHEREYSVLSSLVFLRVAQISAETGKAIYARQLLAQAAEQEKSYPWLPELKYRRKVLQSLLEDRIVIEDIPDVDGVLLLRAKAALAADDSERAAQILDAAEDHQSAAWNILRGRAAMTMMDYRAAVKYLKKAETVEPEKVIPMLEICFREMGDYKTAYAYACKARDV